MFVAPSALDGLRSSVDAAHAETRLRTIMPMPLVDEDTKISPVMKSLLTCLCMIVFCPLLRAEKHQLALGCLAQPDSVHPGVAVDVTGTALGEDPRKPSTFTWESTGGRLSSAGNTARINTSGLNAGEYTITGKVVQGDKPNQQATCTARFKVVPFEPPSVSCRAVPNQVPSGSTVDILTTAASAQNRPLTYAYSVSAGKLSGTGAAAKLSTQSVQAGTINVTCYVVDDRGLSASANTQVVVGKPVSGVLTAGKQLCGLNFMSDRQHSVRVDAAAESCLDSVSYMLRQSPGAMLMIVGNALPTEPPENAAERAMNARQYLVDVRKVSAARIDVRVGETSGPTARLAIIPAGELLPTGGGQEFDEALIVRHGEPYVRPGASLPASRRAR